MKIFCFAAFLGLALIASGSARAVETASADPQFLPVAQADTQMDAQAEDSAGYGRDASGEEMAPPPTPIDNGKVLYISGGVGDSSMERMQAEQQGYNLKLLFVAGPEYIAAVNVKITDGKGGDVLEARADGPVLLVKMPPGRYNVQATAAGGSVLAQQVKVRARGLSSYVFRYPASEED